MQKSNNNSFLYYPIQKMDDSYNPKYYQKQKNTLLDRMHNEKQISERFNVLKSFLGNRLKTVVENIPHSSPSNPSKSMGFNQEMEDNDNEEEFKDDVEEIIVNAKEKAKEKVANFPQIKTILNLSKEMTKKTKIKIMNKSNIQPINQNNKEYLQNFYQSHSYQNKKLKNISNDISKLYKKINKLTINAKCKYDLELDNIQPIPTPAPDFKEILKSPSFNFPYLENNITPKLPIKIKSFSLFKDFTHKYRDNKIPAQYMKKLSVFDRSDLNISKNSKLILPDLNYDKLGLKNKSLPSLYDS